jgi:hypothetical protein
MTQLSRVWPWSFIEVVWDDATGNGGWEGAKSMVVKKSRVHTFGLLVYLDKEYLIVASSIYWDDEDKEHMLGDKNQIPLAMIREIYTPLGENPKAKVKLPAKHKSHRSSEKAADGAA